ncbi:glycosyltransferase family 2 protein [Danxiaibacter flavus]|uniref:Glycosyltransferase family 2 protein n=1 Tax=Danxiaibacter flavus TaxID=3049108 RepID=A0ABV3ZLG8_9BACT|nr:glycosyltransferase family 2 protein [Chitinophagaceae bacterium DXS]
MEISVVIPTCNRAGLLQRCLNLLHPSVQKPTYCSYEIIVTDDSSDIFTKQLVTENYPWVKWYAGPGKGPAANRNNGAARAKGNWIVFIDDDCIPDEHIIRCYKRAIEQNPDIMAFEGAILPDNWSLLRRDLSECPVNIGGNLFWSANICINAALFWQIKGFNENYRIAAQEDQQMKLDIVHYKKKEIKFLPQCQVVHPVRFTSIGRQLKKIPAASKNYAVYAYKNREVLHYENLSAFISEQTKFHLRNAFRQMKTRKFRSMLVSLAWVVYGVPLNIINLQKQKGLV